MKKYVIIGNSAAAIGAVQGIRSVDRDGSITIITDEAYHTYSRPLISLSLIHISEPTRQAEISYAVFCLKKKMENIRKCIPRQKANEQQ